MRKVQIIIFSFIFIGTLIISFYSFFPYLSEIESFKCRYLGLNRSCAIAVLFGNKETAAKKCKEGSIRFCDVLFFLTDLSSDSSEKMLRVACEGGSGAGCFYYGLHHKDKDKAAFEKSCEIGVVAGCFEAGLLMKKDSNEKYKDYFQRSCNGGLLKGCVLLGVDEEDEKNIAEIVKKISKIDYKNDFDPEVEKKIIKKDLSRVGLEAAIFFAKAGKKEKSIYYLKKAIDGDKKNVYKVIDNKVFDTLRKDPDYIDIESGALESIERELRDKLKIISEDS